MTLSISSSLPEIIQHLRGGRDAAGYQTAVGKLWDKYFLRMTLVAHRKLAGAHCRARDEEDIAVSAFKSFFAGMQAGKYQRDGYSDLWPLLVTLTVRKAIDHLRHELRAKRGGNADLLQELVDDLIDAEPTPELQLIACESLEQLFSALDATGDASLRIVALLRLEELRPAEIAQQLGCTVRTVQRKLKTIEAIWNELDGSAPGGKPVA